VTNADWLEKDFYKTLGVARDASADDIKKAYRKLARTNHPDSNKGDAAAEERFKSISEAYSVLSDPDKRKQYDEQRSLFGSGGFRYPRGGTTGGTTFDLGDLFGPGGSGGGGLGDILGGIFTSGGGRTRTTVQPRRGADVETEASLSFAQALDGVTVPLRMTSDAPCGACSGTGARSGTIPKVCPRCEGTGMQTASQGGVFAMTEPCEQCRGRGLIVEDPCPVCHGSGRGTSSRTMQVRIPAGVRDGQRIRLSGKGAAGERGGPAGDLYVTVHVQPHPLFGRSGDNLTLTAPVTFDEAALGAEVKVPTLDGAPVTVRIPPGTPNGRTFRVRGRGVRRRTGMRGDLLVSVEVVVPKELSEPAKEALAAYRQAADGSDPRAALWTLAGTDG
jgi:molecular chaperone DnaJ